MKKTVFLITIIVVLTFKCVYIQAQNLSPDKRILSMLNEFYSAYITEISNGKPNTFKYKIDSIKKKYCTIKLITKLPSLSEKRDADPLLDAQDCNIESLKSLTIEKNSQKSNEYIVSYTDFYSKTKFSVKLVVIKKGGKYMIDSIL